MGQPDSCQSIDCYVLVLVIADTARQIVVVSSLYQHEICICVLFLIRMLQLRLVVEFSFVYPLDVC